VCFSLRRRKKANMTKKEPPLHDWFQLPIGEAEGAHVTTRLMYPHKLHVASSSANLVLPLALVPAYGLCCAIIMQILGYSPTQKKKRQKKTPTWYACDACDMCMFDQLVGRITTCMK
jgi:hypothetical protein